ncbi:MAG: polyhydroxyalkanoate depolymerase [Alphaproteobacteria bacterium]|nr:polyhydroxyalkanoate depolymerase [Alphaproteobacteria bacterium]
MLYQVYDFSHLMAAPMRAMAGLTKAMFQNPLMPETGYARAMAAGAELLERTTRRYAKPKWMLDTTEINGQKVPVTVKTVMQKPFCNLLRFERKTTNNDPKVLIVAPMSGHHATLLRGTVQAMLPEHDVYITDWIDARLVPRSAGKFDLEDNVSYIMDFIRAISSTDGGPDVHVMAVCQPAVPVLCAVSLMAQMKDPCQARSMTLMGGPIDTRRAQTQVTKLGKDKPLSWFERTVISTVPMYYPGASRRIYPGFVQLSGFMSMNMDRHVGEHMRLFHHLVKGDGSSAESHRKFYDEYLSVMDITAEFYLQTVERVFQEHALPEGTFRWKNMTVDPSAIEQTALLTIEGELDDISAPGQTIAAHDLCKGLKPSQKEHHLIKEVGHYGIFNGRRWRTEIQPLVKAFIRNHESEVRTAKKAV